MCVCVCVCVSVCVCEVHVHVLYVCEMPAYTLYMYIIYIIHVQCISHILQYIVHCTFSVVVTCRCTVHVLYMYKI